MTFISENRKLKNFWFCITEYLLQKYQTQHFFVYTIFQLITYKVMHTIYAACKINNQCTHSNCVSYRVWNFDVYRDWNRIKHITSWFDRRVIESNCINSHQNFKFIVELMLFVRKFLTKNCLRSISLIFNHIYSASYHITLHRY